MYIEPEKLAELLRDAKEHGVGDDLLRVGEQMIEGCYWRFGSKAGIDKDDYQQECWLALLRAIKKFDGSASAFTYLTTAFRNEVLWAIRKQKRHAHEQLPLEV